MSPVERCRRLLAEAESLRYEDPRRAVRMAEEVRDRAAAALRRRFYKVKQRLKDLAVAEGLIPPEEGK